MIQVKNSRTAVLSVAAARRLFKTLAALLLTAVCLTACDNAAVIPFDQALQNGRVSLDISAANFLAHEKQILQDDEPFAVITDGALRLFSINNPIVITQKHESQFDDGAAQANPIKRQIPVETNQFRVTSYMIVPVYNVEIWATLAGYPHSFKIMTIAELPPLAQNIYNIPFSLREGNYVAKNGSLVHIPRIPDLQRDMVRLEIKCTDRVYQKLLALKTHWNIGFLGADNGISWKRINGPHAREWIAVISNLAYTFSSPEFDVLMDHYKALTGNYFVAGTNRYYHTDTDTNKVPGTEGEREELYRRIFFTRERPKRLNLGWLDSKAGAVGLGGGSTLGIATYAFFSHYRGGSAVTVHELGHCLGFGHDSSFCYGTLESYLPGLTAMFTRLGQVPYPSPEIVGYYKPQYDWARWLEFGDGTPAVNTSESLRRGFAGIRADGINQFERFIYNNSKYFSQETSLLLKPWFDLNITEPPIDSGLNPDDDGQHDDIVQEIATIF